MCAYESDRSTVVRSLSGLHCVRFVMEENSEKSGNMRVFLSSSMCVCLYVCVCVCEKPFYGGLFKVCVAYGGLLTMVYMLEFFCVLD